MAAQIPFSRPSSVPPVNGAVFSPLATDRRALERETLKGRGAVSNRSGRHEKHIHIADDDGWALWRHFRHGELM